MRCTWHGRSTCELGVSLASRQRGIPWAFTPPSFGVRIAGALRLRHFRPMDASHTPEVPDRLELANAPEPSRPLAEGDDALPRRDFLRLAGAGAGFMLAGWAPPVACASAPARGIERGRGPSPSSSHVVIVGAGAWGGWTAYHLRARGVRVTLIDQYGPGNSRSTSGDETRGIRSSYGDRAAGELWTPWARAAIARL